MCLAAAAAKKPVEILRQVFNPDKYRPSRPKKTPLHRLLDSHYEEFRNVYDERFSKRYGFWRPVTDEVVDKYLQCGDPHYGFARIRCKECGAEYLRAFSCNLNSRSIYTYTG